LQAVYVFWCALISTSEPRKVGPCSKQKVVRASCGHFQELLYPWQLRGVLAGLPDRNKTAEGVWWFCGSSNAKRDASNPSERNNPHAPPPPPPQFKNIYPDWVTHLLPGMPGLPGKPTSPVGPRAPVRPFRPTGPRAPLGPRRPGSPAVTVTSVCTGLLSLSSSAFWRVINLWSCFLSEVTARAQDGRGGRRGEISACQNTRCVPCLTRWRNLKKNNGGVLRLSTLLCTLKMS